MIIIIITTTITIIIVVVIKNLIIVIINLFDSFGIFKGMNLNMGCLRVAGKIHYMKHFKYLRYYISMPLTDKIYFQIK